MEIKIGTSDNSSQPECSGDWFVFSNGEFLGPLSATRAFSMESKDALGRPVLISRKGFNQWYALNEIAEIFKVTQNLDLRLEGEKAPLLQQQIISNAIENRKQTSTLTHQVTKSTRTPSKIVKKLVGPINQRLGNFSSQALDAAKSLKTKKSDVVTPKTGDLREKKSHLGQSFLHRFSLTKKCRVRQGKKDLLQEYFNVRGRLRLGKIRNPWANAFFGLPLSLGFMWSFWMNNLIKEIIYHSASRINTSQSLVLMGLVPGFHLYAVFRLAQLVLEMEMQNKYKSVSPLLATALALFPPFAMAYLQNAANRHWLVHVRHACSQKMSINAP